MFWGKGGGGRWKKRGRRWVFREVAERDERRGLYFGNYSAWVENEEKLEEGDNSRTRISVNDWEDKERRGSCSQYYWSVGSGARKPMGFLRPAHDESWLVGWHIILLIKALMESWKRKQPTRSTTNCWIYYNLWFQVFKF